MLKICFVFFVLTFSSNVFAQKKLDLDDINIKGELHNDNRLRLVSRDKNSLKNYVKFRTNYRKAIVEELPRYKPAPKY
ncbi:MAG: hypothetical protein KDD58_10635 [Bdellovibrionales bacterium]|nr:hypothetical protein [Bdellovibrionales bacterium]